MEQQREFETLIRKDRDSHRENAWRGNFLGYLEKVKEDSTIAKLAHARIYDIIIKAGVRDIQETDDPHLKKLYKDGSIKIYNFWIFSLASG